METILRSKTIRHREDKATCMPGGRLYMICGERRFQKNCGENWRGPLRERTPFKGRARIIADDVIVDLGEGIFYVSSRTLVQDAQAGPGFEMPLDWYSCRQ